MRTGYLSLGSNLGDRESHLRRALEQLEGPVLTVTRVSPLFETQPRDLVNQPWFLNLVAEVETPLFPMQLLSRALAVERSMGRARNSWRGPRVIDIDILLWGNVTIRTARLEIPHPRMLERRFVLEPLAALAPDLRHPVSRRTIADHLSRIRGQECVLVGLPVHDH